MAYFAKLDENNIVTRIITTEQELVDNGVFGEQTNLIEVDTDGSEGIHFLPDDNHIAGTPLIKASAGIGSVYDRDKKVFYIPKPYPSWTLNEDTCLWEAPVPCPDDDEMYIWDEENQGWDLIERNILGEEQNGNNT